MDSNADANLTKIQDTMKKATLSLMNVSKESDATAGDRDNDKEEEDDILVDLRRKEEDEEKSNVHHHHHQQRRSY